MKVQVQQSLWMSLSIITQRRTAALPLTLVECWKEYTKALLELSELRMYGVSIMFHIER